MNAVTGTAGSPSVARGSIAGSPGPVRPDSSRIVLAPDGADELEFPVDRLGRDVQRLRDLLRGLALEPSQSDGPQRRIGQPVEEAGVIVGEADDLLGGRLAAEDC